MKTFHSEKMQISSGFSLVATVLATALTFATASSSATVIDLVGGTDGTANGTLYSRIDTQPTGTGVFQPFLRVQGKEQSVPAGSEQGYNADYANAGDVPFDEKVGTWTHSLQFGNLVYTEINGVGYYEFLLDLDDPNSARQKLISLDKVQIYTSASALSAPYSTDLSTLGTKRYDMDVGADGDVTVNLDGSLTSGNGQSDMVMYVLASNFAGVNQNDYVTFYSYFGDPYYADGSFEEWGLRACEDCQPPHRVVEPGPLALLALGLMGLYATRRRQQ